jgi:cysteinylglycine-S-conjugate dipeptidase
MQDDLAARVRDLFPSLTDMLADLVRIPSVSAAGFPAEEVRRSATHLVGILEASGFSNVQLLELEGAHPAVFGEIAAPEGAPTVLLYAHHDVQPPGPAEEWRTGPFEPFVENGRMYGRGASDDKAGIIMHLGAIAAFDGRPPVGVKVFFEGEEEIGSAHLGDFLDRYSDLLAADVIVIGDSGNWRVGQPALTTSLRGLVSCVVEVRTAANAVHSGMFGGAFPDALTTLARLLSTLHDDEGNVAIPGLVANEADPLDLTEDEVRQQMGAVPGLTSIGSGGLTGRLWTKPAVSVLAIDAPPISEAINQLVPVARAKVSMRIAPGQDPAAAMNALRSHLLDNVPWGADLTFLGQEMGSAFQLAISGPAPEAWKSAMRQVWGTDIVEMGVGGSIPFVADFSERFPHAEILLTGAGDPTSAFHAPNESQDLGDLEKCVLAEALALSLLADSR